jgi:hypothetical protein
MFLQKGNDQFIRVKYDKFSDDNFSIELVVLLSIFYFNIII